MWYVKKDFSLRGFFGRESARWEKRNRKELKDWFKFCEVLNTLACSIPGELKLRRGDNQQLIAACLFFTTHKRFQAAMLLCARGLIQEASAVARVTFEALVLLKNVCQSQEFTQAYIDEDTRRKLTLLNVAQTHDDDDTLAGLRDMAEEGAIEELRSEVEALETTYPKSIWTLAQRVDMAADYDTQYRGLSNSAHIGVRVLQEEFLNLDESGDLASIRLTPSTKGCETVVVTASENLIQAIAAIRTFFDLPFDPKVSELHEQLSQLCGMNEVNA